MNKLKATRLNKFYNVCSIFVEFVGSLLQQIFQGLNSGVTSEREDKTLTAVFFGFSSVSSNDGQSNVDVVGKLVVC